MADDKTFVRVELLHEPILVGARWWQESLEVFDPVARRRALLGLVGVGASLALVGGVVSAVKAVSPQPVAKDATAAQREYGWSFGAEDEALVFSGDTAGTTTVPSAATTEPFDRGSLSSLATDLQPRNPALRPYYVPTLFQSLTAEPTGTPPPSDEPPKRLVDVLQPLGTPAMDAAFLRGEALSSLFDEAPPGKAVVVDLPGPEAVAFAAGLSARLEPVFLFDNWPHPRGVVPSHLTLAAAARYQRTLVTRAGERSLTAPPAFVVDETRLAPYAEQGDRFDNRYVAKMPGADRMKELGITEVLYVSRQAPSAPSEPREQDDLNDVFCAYAQAGIAVRMVQAESFGPAADEVPPTVGSSAPTRRYYYGAAVATHLWFWHHYGWGTRGMAPTAPPPRAVTYRPLPRGTAFGGAGAPFGQRPAGFGVVRVSGGSWARTGGSGGG